MKKMKLLSMALVVALMLCLPIGVSAAPESPGLPSMPQVDTAATVGLPQYYGIVAGPAKNASTMSSAESFISANNPDGACVGLYDISLQYGDELKSSCGNTVTVTLNAPGINSSHKVYMVHETSGGFEVLKATAGDGTVTFQTNSFSLFALVVGGTFPDVVTPPYIAPPGTGNNGGQNNSSPASTSSTTTNRSPQTGVYA